MLRAFVHALTLLTVLGWGNSVAAEASAARVVMLLSEEGGAYRALANSFRVQLRDAPWPVPTAEVLSLAAAQPRQLKDANTPQLIVTVGTRAAQQALEWKPSAPLLHLLITKSAHEALTRSDGDRPKASAIFLEQPWERQLEFTRLLLPAAKRLGVILGPSSANQGAALKATAQRGPWTLNIDQIANENDSAVAIKRTTEISDAMLAVPDPVVLTPNSAKWLLYISYQRGIPVLGFSKAYVSAGAVGAVYSTPEQIARQAAELVLNAARRGDWELGGPVHPKYFSVAVNRSVARSLRIDVPDELELTRKLTDMEGSGK